MRVDPHAFDDIYRDADDPWHFATSAYELDRYATTLASLSRPTYSRCFEPACSIGVLTEGLSARVEDVVACDGAADAIAQARHRLVRATNVELVVAAIPEWWPEGEFDLIVLSELGYYWDNDGWGDVIERCRMSAREDAELIAVHWLGTSPDHVTTGQAVHAELVARFGPSDLHIERFDAAGDDGFMLDRWSVVDRG